MAMITFFVNRNKVCDGRDILSSLRKLSNRLIITGDYSYSGIEEDISKLRISRSTHVIPQRVVAKDTVSTEPRIGYKEYTFIFNGNTIAYNKRKIIKYGQMFIKVFGMLVNDASIKGNEISSTKQIRSNISCVRLSLESWRV
jgi:hypothetical protein